MKDKLMLESFVIATLLAVILSSTLINSVFAWGYKEKELIATSDGTWRLGCKVRAYYDVNPAEYEEIHHWTWRWADGIYTSYYGYLFSIWYSSKYTYTDYTAANDDSAGFPVWPPASYAGTYVGAYFYSSTYGLFYAEAVVQV